MTTVWMKNKYNNNNVKFNTLSVGNGEANIILSKDEAWIIDLFAYCLINEKFFANLQLG